MVNEVLQTVMDYVKLPHTDYAILINGPWGCGKTYFWKEIVEPELKSLLESQQIERIMYASLYGISNVRDIDRLLFAQSYPGINHKAVSKVSRFLGGVVEASGRFNLEKVDFRSLVKVSGAIICFDDLERSYLPFEAVLGYINTFVEHEGAKVVILCNEDGINNRNKKVYREMKEKVVGNSLDYQPDYETVLSTLTNEYKDQEDQKEFHGFLINNSKLILHLFKSSERNNLRSLRRAITALNMVFKTINEGCIDPNMLAEQLIYAVGTTAFELYGRAADAEKLRSIHKMDYMSLTGISMRALRNDKAVEKTYEEQFNERYFKQHDFLYPDKAVGCPPICDYMITGYLDKDSLLQWAKKLTDEPDEKEQKVKHLTFNHRHMDDEEFERIKSQVLCYIESGDFPDIKTYIGLYYHFKFYVDADIVDLTQEKLLEKFKKGVLIAWQAGRLTPDSRLQFEIKHLLEEPRSKECQDFCDFILGLNEQIFEHQRLDLFNNLLSSIEAEPAAFINALTSNEESGFYFRPVFHRLDSEDMASKILSMSNNSKTQFWDALRERYVKYPHSEYIEEIPALKRIRDVLKNNYEKSAKGSQLSMSLYITQKIIETLDQAIDQLNEITQQKTE